LSHLTPKRLLASVAHHVPFEIARFREHLAAHLTGVKVTEVRPLADLTAMGENSCLVDGLQMGWEGEVTIAELWPLG